MNIKTSITLTTLSVSLTILLVGCGGSSDSTPPATGATTITGTFVDAPAQGLHFQTPTQSGFTDAKGQFKYVAGEEVEFKLGNLVLGKGDAGTLVTPYTISDNNDTATNIALLLQNFDGNRSNTSVLDLSKLRDFHFTVSDFNLTARPSAMESKLSTLLATASFQSLVDENNNTLVNATTVKRTMDNYITNTTTITVQHGFGTEWIKNNTMYIPLNENGNKHVAVMKFENGFRKIYIDGAIAQENGVDMINPYTITSNGWTDVDETSIGNTHQVTKVTAVNGTRIDVITGTMDEVKNGTADTQVRFTTLDDAQAYLNQQPLGKPFS